MWEFHTLGRMQPLSLSLSSAACAMTMLNYVLSSTQNVISQICGRLCASAQGLMTQFWQEYLWPPRAWWMYWFAWRNAYVQTAFRDFFNPVPFLNIWYCFVILDGESNATRGIISVESKIILIEYELRKTSAICCLGRTWMVTKAHQLIDMQPKWVDAKREKWK